MCDLALYRAKLQETRLNFNISVTVTQANFTNTHPTREQNKWAKKKAFIKEKEWESKGHQNSGLKLLD